MKPSKLKSLAPAQEELEPVDASNDVVLQGMLLTEQILIDFESGMTRKAISEKHNMSYSTVCKIIRNVTTKNK